MAETLEEAADRLAARAEALSRMPNTLGQTFSAALQEYYLRQPDGSLGYANATPAALQPTVMKLIEMSARAQELVREAALLKSARLGGGSLGTGSGVFAREIKAEPGPENPTVQAYDARLQHYLEVINDCIAAGRFSDPDCVFWRVTAPLLLGWYPNADGDGPDPSQTGPRAADAGYAARMLYMAGVKVDADQRNTLSQALLESADDLATGVGDQAKKSWELIEGAAAKIRDWVDPAKRLKTPALLLAGAVGLGLLYLYSKKGRRF